MANYNKKTVNPVRHMPGALLWIFCFPIAFVIDFCYGWKKSEAKRKAKRHRKAVEHWDWWNSL